MINFTQSDFQEKVIDASHKSPVVVDFWAPWCGPCRAIKPFVEKLALEFEGRMVVGAINRDDSGELAKQYEITGIPTLLFFRNGQVEQRHVGSCSYQDLRKVFLEFADKVGAVRPATDADATREKAFAAAAEVAEKQRSEHIGRVLVAYTEGLAKIEANRSLMAAYREGVAEADKKFDAAITDAIASYSCSNEEAAQNPPEQVAESAATAATCSDGVCSVKQGT